MAGNFRRGNAVKWEAGTTLGAEGSCPEVCEGLFYEGSPAALRRVGSNFLRATGCPRNMIYLAGVAQGIQLQSIGRNFSGGSKCSIAH